MVMEGNDSTESNLLDGLTSSSSTAGLRRLSSMSSLFQPSPIQPRPQSTEQPYGYSSSSSSNNANISEQWKQICEFNLSSLASPYISRVAAAATPQPNLESRSFVDFLQKQMMSPMLALANVSASTGAVATSLKPCDDIIIPPPGPSDGKDFYISPQDTVQDENVPQLNEVFHQQIEEIHQNRLQVEPNRGRNLRKRSISKTVSCSSTDSGYSSNVSNSTDPPRTKKKARRKRGAGVSGGKLCTVEGCTTRDKGGGLCAKHGGGRPCKHEGCDKIVAGLRFCAKHGGRRKKSCSVPSCPKGDQGGGFCAAHGGGRRCTKPNCQRRDIGKGLCWAHGGGKRCKNEGCLRCPSIDGYCKLHYHANLANQQADDEEDSELI